ncbi:hypothetical protein ACHAXN_011685 [Cyclotella atomus]
MSGQAKLRLNAMVMLSILPSSSILLLCLDSSTATAIAEEEPVCIINGHTHASSAAVGFNAPLGMPYCTLSADNNVTEEDNTEDTLDWESFSFLDMHEYFDCTNHVYNTAKPLYTPAMWKQMRDLFEEQSEIDMSSSKIDETHVQNYYAGYADESRGRGAFAARNFTKGDLVHDGAISTVFWTNGDGWREYVMALPQTMACDVLEWTWIQTVPDYGPLLCLNLNDAAFMNHDDEFNIAPKDRLSLELYAQRDITEGEELTYDYYIYETDWELFDL